MSLLSLLLFIFTEKRVANPILPLHLFRNRQFLAPNLAVMTSHFGMFGVIMYMPLYVQGVLGLSASVSGYVTAPLMVSTVVASTVSGQIISRSGKYKKLAMFGMGLMSFGMFLLSRLDADASVFDVVLRLIIVGIGSGITNPILNVSVQNSVPDRMLGVVTSAMQLFRQFGSTIGVTVAGAFITANAAMRMQAYTDASGMDPDLAAELGNPQLLVDKEKMRKLETEFGGLPGESYEAVIGALQDALNGAISGPYVLGFVMVLIAFVMVTVLKEVPLRNYRTKDDEPIPGMSEGSRNMPAAGK